MRVSTIAGWAALALGAAMCPGVAHAGVFDIAGPGALNVDTNPATNVNLNAPISGIITDINIQIVMADNNTGSTVFLSDWSLTLTHGATSVVLKPIIVQLTGNNIPLDVTLDDAAASLWTSSLSSDGTFRPSSPLAAFNGADLAGIWTLSFLDTVQPNEDDQLVSWRIFGTVTDVPEPASLALLGAGFAGLALARRRRTG